jgi:hypothetical protein
MRMNKDLEKMGKETIGARFKILYLHSAGWSEKTHGKSQSR